MEVRAYPEDPLTAWMGLNIAPTPAGAPFMGRVGLGLPSSLENPWPV